MTRRSSALLVMAVCLALFGLASMAFVSAPEAALRGETALTATKDRAAQAAAISAAVLTVPEIAHAGNSGYALLQLGWAIFIISLGPAVLFWIYFNKPELLWAPASVPIFEVQGIKPGFRKRKPIETRGKSQLLESICQGMSWHVMDLFVAKCFYIVPMDSGQSKAGTSCFYCDVLHACWWHSWRKRALLCIIYDNIWKYVVWNACLSLSLQIWKCTEHWPDSGFKCLV